MLISFSGVDCAGKSTQIELLRAALLARGFRPALMWYRPGYSKALNAARGLLRWLLPRSVPAPTDVVTRQLVFRRPFVARVWILVAVLDSILQYAGKVRLLRAMGRVVLVDRYIDDAVMDLQYRFPDSDVEHSLLWHFACWLAAKPSHRVLLLLPYDVMLERMAAKKEPFPDVPRVRDARYERYLALASSGRFRVVDANRPPQVVHADILSALET